MPNVSESDLMGLQDTKARVASYERHWQTVLMAVMISGLAFTGRFMWNVNAQLAEFVVENRNLALQVARLDGSVTTMNANFIPRKEFESYIDRVRALEAKK